jgi:V/A-type H+-transporting ATPase subunit E
MTSDGNIERLSRDILQQAESDAERVLLDAKAKAEQIIKQAEEDAAAEKTRILDRAKRDSDRIRSQAVATTQLKARTMILDSREKLLSEVFKEAQMKLASVQQYSDYSVIVERLVMEAVSQMTTNNVVIRADKKTSQLLADTILNELAAKFDGTIELGDVLENKIGVIASTSNGHLNYDNTLETRLEKLTNELRSPVYHLLQGESL